MRKVLSVYWYYTKGIRRYALITILLFAAAMLFRDIFRPYVLKDLVDGLTTHRTDASYLWYQVFLFGIVHLIAQVCFRGGEFAIAAFESRHKRNLSNGAFKKMIKHSLAFFAGNYTGALVTKQKRFVHSGEVIFDEFVESSLSMLIQVVGIAIVVSFISIPMMLGIVVWVGFYITNAIVMSKKRLALDADEANNDSRVTGAYADVIGNVSVMKTFGSAERERKRFSKIVNNHYKALITAWNFSNTQSVIQGIFSTVIHVGSIAAALALWLSNKMTTGEIILITMYSGQLSGSLWNFGKNIRRYSKAFSDAKEMVDIMNTPIGVKDASGALKEVALTPAQARVEFKNISFAYNESAVVFKDFNLEIPAGQKVAIIGPTGAGKTSLISLLLRTVDVQEGSICIGPYNIRTDVSQDAFKSCVSCVSQNIDLFNRSIGENIGYGNPDATAADIITASKKAFIHDFIEGLPNTYNTMVGERGVKLSGGQRQRIGIARALLHNAPILIFDEATSSLDNITERAIQGILENGLKEKTVIVIAHRLSTIKNCDRIIVLDKGTIAQDGNHDQLVTDTEGIYYQMLHSHDVANKEQIFE